MTYSYVWDGSRQVDVLGLAVCPDEVIGNNKWIDADGNTIWPPNNGAIQGTEEIINFKEGIEFGRIGNEYGAYVAPPKTSPEKLALSPMTDISNYTEYRVVKPITDIEKAQVAPWFDMPGGGTQFKLPTSIKELVETGYIEVITK